MLARGDRQHDIAAWFGVNGGRIEAMSDVCRSFGISRKTGYKIFNLEAAFSAFLVALFTEMYGFPLTIYFLSGWLQTRYPNVDRLSHDAGHLLEMLFGWNANPHFGPFHILSNVLIVVGFLVISAAWRVLYEAQRKDALATTGPYAYVRHPQYVGFILVMFGFLLQWPTLLTLAMFPVLVWMYVRLARAEEREVRSAFGDAYDRYAAQTPAWFPRLSASAQAQF